MVPASRPRPAHLAHHGVLLGRARVGQVGQGRQRGGQSVVDLSQLGVERLLTLARAAHGGDGLGGVVALALQLADALARRVLVGAQALQLGQKAAPPLVKRERPVQRGRRLVAAPRERGARGAGSLRIALRSSTGAAPGVA